MSVIIPKAGANKNMTYVMFLLFIKLINKIIELLNKVMSYYEKLPIHQFT